ncbi:MAG: YfhO family protein [Ignavibacteriales bacterium]|nr:YfhO family protein [Ignavibacteriales bacterium]
MSKTHKERTGSRQTAGESPLIPERYQHAVAIALLFLSLVLFFNQLIFSGKTFSDVDQIASRSFDTFLADAKAQGVFPLWNPYIFCGMPSYGSLTVGGDRLFDLTAQVNTTASTAFSHIILNPPEGWVLFYYFVFACGIYLFTFHKVKSKFAAFIAAFAATFSMYIIIWVMSGHNTKISVLAFFPFIFYSIERLRDRFSWFQAFLLVLLIHFSYMPSHVQMIFYVYLAVGTYLVFMLIRSLVMKKEHTVEAGAEPAWKGVLRAGVVFALASALAFSMDADKYLSVWEYSSYSIRGSNPIVNTAPSTDSKTVQGGLDYDYATSWSFAPGEMMTWLVPSWYGFGIEKYKGVFTNNQEQMANFYSGPQPFTHAPQYMGLIVLLLALYGFARNRKDPFVQYLALMIVFSLLISFGREFPVFYDVMYKFFPMFNKFRIPSMILALIQIFVPILAAYGIATLIRERADLHGAQVEKRKKSIVLSFAAVIGFFVVLALTFESFVTRQAVQNAFASLFNYGLPRDKIYDPFFQQVQPQVIKEVTAQLVERATSDIYVAIVLLAVSFGTLYYFIQGKMKLATFAIILTLIIATDLWRVDSKPADFHDRSINQQMFATPEYAKYLQRDSTLYRILELENGQPKYNNMFAYWRLQSAYGYQGAKMRTYQDVAEVVGLRNPLIWSLMNVNYILSPSPDSTLGLPLVYNGRDLKIYGNPVSLPRAFFVNRYEVADGLTTLNKIKSMSFNPRDVMYFQDDPKLTVEAVHPAARIEFTRYNFRNSIHEMELKTTTAGNNLLFFSETYYPVGWKAYVDGKETPIYRANYLFRAVMVPGGVHTIEMKFEPKGFFLGKNLSLAANIVTLGGLGFFGFAEWRKRKARQRPTEQAGA